MKTANLILAGVMASASLFSAGAALAKDWKVINFGTEAAYEPWNLTKPDGSVDGFEADLTKDIAKRIGADVKFVVTDWDSAIASLSAGKFDALTDAVSITDERKKIIDFTIPYAATPATFEVLKGGSLEKLAGTGKTVKFNADGTGDKATIDALKAAFKGKTIGIQTATVYSKFVYDNFRDVADIREYKTIAEYSLDIQAGRIDAAFDDATAIGGTISKPENSNLVMAGPQIAGPVWGEGMGYGVAKGNPDLTAKLNEGLKAALADGTVRKLSVKWFNGLDVTPQ